MNSRLISLLGVAMLSLHGFADVTASNFTLTGPDNGSVTLSWTVSGSAGGGIFGGWQYLNGTYNVAVSRGTSSTQSAQSRTVVGGENDGAYMTQQNTNSGHVTDTPPATGQTYYYWLHYAPYNIIDDSENFFANYLTYRSQSTKILSSPCIGPISVFVPAPGPKKVTVTFHSNDGGEDMTDQEFEKGVSKALKKNGFSRSGYEFQGWATTEDGGVAYEDEQEVSIDANLTLYAVWREMIVLVSFDPNGGEGEMGPQEFKVGVPDDLIKNTFCCTGSVFMGWSTNATDEVVYEDEAEITVYSNLTLYAVWDVLKLEITEVNWLAGSATLDWSKTERGILLDCPCTLYRGTTKDFASAQKVVENTTATFYVDNEFLATRPKIGPLYYWIVPSVAEDGFNPGDGLETRRRCGLFVGFSDYATNPNTGKAWADAFAAMWPTTESVAKMFGEFGFRTECLPNTSSQYLSQTILQKAEECSKGDIFVLWIFTHGGTTMLDTGRVSFLAMKPYLDRYFASQMANDLAAFKRETAVLPIIYACHSGGMLDFSDVASTSDIMALVNSGLAQCHGGEGGVAACSANVTSPAVGGSITEVDSFARFFIDSKDIADNGDCDLTLHEMVEYVQGQQILFTPYAIAEEVNGGALNDVLVMTENAERTTGTPPSTPTGLQFVENSDGSVTFSWGAAQNAEWYSDQGITENRYGFIYRNRVTYGAMAFKQGRTYTFTVYAGNKYGRSEGASIEYVASKNHVALQASKNRFDGIEFTWDTNIDPGVISYWKLLSVIPAILFRPAVSTTIATIPENDRRYWDGNVDVGEYNYQIVGYDDSGSILVCSDLVLGRRVGDYSLSISPAAIELSADCGETAERYFSIDVRANAPWEYKLADGSFCSDIVADRSMNGRIYLYCQSNNNSLPRSTELVVSIKKSDGTTIAEKCTITQLGTSQACTFDDSILQWKKRFGLSSDEDLLTGRDANGIPYLMSYAFQGSLADNEIPKLVISIDGEGNPCVSMPKQNPFTALDVSVELEKSSDLCTWSSVREKVGPNLSKDGCRELHYPRKTDSAEFFRFKVDLR